MINQKRACKIALVGDTLSGGGAEKVHAHLSVYFQNAGIDVANCIFADSIFYTYSGSLFNLGKIRPEGFFITRKIARYLAFKKFIRQNNFDHVIDFRMRDNQLLEFMISKFVYRSNAVYTVRSAILGFYFPKSAFLSRLLYKDKKIITVSKAIKEAVIANRLAHNASFIHNPVNLEDIAVKKNAFEVAESNYIIAVGRMNDNVKQFDKLILAYSKSILPARGIRLLFLGQGKNKEAYAGLAEALDLGHMIVFNDFVDNPYPYYKSALFSVLSSKNEGFPNVIVEALASGIPVVSFNCFSGPSEIIEDNHNGILVENQNFDKLTAAMNLMADDFVFYNSCKQNAAKSVEKLSLGNIGRQWLEYLKINVS